MQSNMLQHSFAKIAKKNIPRSTFDKSHSYKTTMDGGKICPIFWERIIPGDTFAVNLTAFVRMATPIVPVMDNIKADVYFFYEPDRLLQTNFPKLMGEQVDPTDSIAYLLPTIPVLNAQEHSLYDYFGLPIKTSNAMDVVSSKFRMYNDVYNTFFRDQNLQDSVTVDRDDGPDLMADYVLLDAGKYHDYFTSCLPWPQKGDAVELPLGTSAEIYGSGMDFDAVEDAANVVNIRDSAGGNLKLLKTTGTNLYGDSAQAGSGQLLADLSNATAATINELRQAFAIQQLLEADARGGTRYIEKIYNIYGVISPDLRPTRPVYLGGGSFSIHMNPIAKTDFTAGTTGANLSGYGTGYGNNIGFTASFTEHGHLLGVCVIRADLTYSQGVERDWLDSTQYDHYMPQFAHIGEQVVYNSEIYFTDEASGLASATNSAAFGYQEMYAHYRFKPSKITGLFRFNATGTLEIWHCSQEFSGLPTLGNTFIKDTPPFDRNIATPAEPHFIYDSYLKVKATRPMPLFGTPGLNRL